MIGLACQVALYRGTFASCLPHTCVLRECDGSTSMLRAGTGKETGDRHPKVHDNVLIGACATVLGNIAINKGAQARLLDTPLFTWHGPSG